MSDRQAERRLEVERHYDLPRALVFAAWTEPERMKHWWGPKGWFIPFSEADLRPGGAFRYAMRSPEGDEHVVEGTIAGIDPPGRYVTVSELGGDGAHPPVRVVTNVTFEEQAGGTLVRIVTDATAAADMLDAATEGMDDHTSEHLGGSATISNAQIPPPRRGENRVRGFGGREQLLTTSPLTNCA